MEAREEHKKKREGAAQSQGQHVTEYRVLVLYSYSLPLRQRPVNAELAVSPGLGGPE